MNIYIYFAILILINIVTIPLFYWGHKKLVKLTETNKFNVISSDYERFWMLASYKYSQSSMLAFSYGLPLLFIPLMINGSFSYAIFYIFKKITFESSIIIASLVIVLICSLIYLIFLFKVYVKSARNKKEIFTAQDTTNLYEKIFLFKATEISEFKFMTNKKIDKTDDILNVLKSKIDKEMFKETRKNELIFLFLSTLLFLNLRTKMKRIVIYKNGIPSKNNRLIDLNNFLMKHVQEIQNKEK